MLDQFHAVARQVSFAPPQIPLISNITGRLATDEVATAEYWCRHVRQAVQFAAGMESLAQEGADILIEIGPKPTLLGMGRLCLLDDDSLWLPSLHPKRNESRQMLSSLAELYVHGTQIEWRGLYSSGASSEFETAPVYRRLPLPTYPFQRQRYWLDGVKESHSSRKEQAHPLLGQPLYSAKTQDIHFESYLSSDSPAYLADHCVMQSVIMPMTGYLEMALAAGANVFGSSQLVLEDVFILQSLVLPENEVRTVQLILTPIRTANASAAQAQYTFQIFVLALGSGDDTHSESKQHSGRTWTLLAEGKLRSLQSGEEPRRQTEGMQKVERLTQDRFEMSVDLFYEQARERGLEYGPSFFKLQQLWRHEHEGQAVGQMKSFTDLQTGAYQLHPVLLDTCFQVVDSAIFEEGDTNSYLPVSLERLAFFGSSDVKWSVASKREQQLSFGAALATLTADVQVFDSSGKIAVEVSGLTFRRAAYSPRHASVARKHGLQKKSQETAMFTSWLYETVWQPKALPNVQQSAPASWLIFGDSEGIAAHLKYMFNEIGEQCVLVLPGLNENSANFERRLHQAAQDGAAPYRGIVYLSGLSDNHDPLTNCSDVLHLVQALATLSERGQKPSSMIWLVTKGAQPVSAPAPLQVNQAPLWGLGRVMGLEHPELSPVCLDLPPDETMVRDQEARRAAKILFEELRQASYLDGEEQIAYRRGIRHVARLMSAPVATKASLPQAGAFKITLDHGGLLDNLRFAPLTPKSVAPNEVEIQIRATGINFRDVLRALGMLEEHLEEASTRDRRSGEASIGLTFGYECAGTITRVGEEVPDFSIGDQVIAFAHDSLASSVTVRSEFVTLKPRELTFEEAATIPLTFLTAYYGLCQLAQMGPGDKVLIHAAAGGVGQAAIQLAMAVGAEVFATASPGKWDFLKAQGVQHIYNSRRLDFAAQIMADTLGQGVDIVLNSLNGEFISKSFEVLAQGGRFIELGKRDIWSESQVQHVRPDASYFPYDLSEEAERDPTLIRAMFTPLMQMFATGRLAPLPKQVFSIQNVRGAFRYMQQARQIGKVVISQSEGESAISIEPESGYLITGGLGALGLKLADWLVSEGARYLVLIGRSGASSAAAKEAISQLKQAGAEVHVVKADVSKRKDVAKLLKESASCWHGKKERPLRGIIHAAGVLDDGVLRKQSQARFEKVMAPKVAGSWNLHLESQALPLDFFICFSSDASLLGSSGQGNYAAANAFLDALAHHRRALGLPGLSINWGAWAESGMAANLSSRHQQRLAELGLKLIPPQPGLQAMGELMGQGAPQVAVLPIDWSRWLQQYQELPPFLENFKTHSRQSSEDQSFLQKLESTPISQRSSLLEAHIRHTVGKVLGTGSEFSLSQGFFDVGMDSLTSIELRNRLQNSLQCGLPPTVAFNYNTIERMADYLASEVLSIEMNGTGQMSGDSQIESEPEIGTLTTEVENLSEADAEAELLEALEGLDFDFDF